MEKETKDEARNRKIDELSRKALQLDDICSSIFLTLMAKKKLRFNELHRALKKLGTDISKPALSDHLKHLTKQKLVVRKVEDAQNVTYGLKQEIVTLLDNSEDVPSWFEHLEGFFEPFDAKEYYRKLSEKELSTEIDRDLTEVLLQNLHELRAFVNYDLKIAENESDAEFWKFVGNPMYRLFEKSIADNCRQSVEYKKKFFEKVECFMKKLEEDFKLGQI